MKLSAFWNITDLLSPAMLLDWLLYMQPQLRVLRRWRPKLQSFLKLRFWDLNSITSSTFYWSKVKGQSNFKAWGNRVHLLLGGVAKNLWPYLIYHTYTIISSSKICATWLVKALFWPSHYAGLKSFLTQCSRQPEQINHNCHKKWNVSAIWTLQWAVDRVWMGNSEFLAFSEGCFFLHHSVSSLLVSSFTFLRLYLKSYLFLSLNFLKICILWGFEQYHHVLCVSEIDYSINHCFKCYQFGYHLNQW